MRIYFLRHADAVDGPDDAARPLSVKGRNQCQELGRFLESAGIAFDAAYSSPLVRARETAELVLRICGQVKPDQVQLVDALLNETSSRDFDAWLRCLPNVEHVLLSGHAPTLAERVMTLVGMEDPGGFRLPKAGLACVATPDGRSGMLKFFITPKLLHH